MWSKLILLSATALMIAGCEDPSVAEMLSQNKEVKTKEKTEIVAKEEVKVFPELRIIAENGTGAGLIIKKEKNDLYIITNGALVASNPQAIVQFSDKTLKQADVHYMSTAHNIAILKVTYKAEVSVPAVYTGELDGLDVYVNGIPYKIQQYEDRIDAFYVKANEVPLLGSPVMEEETGDVVGIYFNRQQQGENEPYVLPLKGMIPLLDEWITKGMKPKDRLEQSRNLMPYIIEGDKGEVKKTIKQYGEDVFAFNGDEVKVFIDEFHSRLQLAVQAQDASILKEFVGADDFQKTLDDTVGYYTSKNAEIRFTSTKVKSIDVKGQNLIVRTKTNYVLTNQAGQEAKGSSDAVYEIFQDDTGSYKMIRLTME